MITLKQILKDNIVYKGSFIGGLWLLPRKPSFQWEHISPANLDWVMPKISIQYDHVDESCESGARAFQYWSRMALSERLGLVKKFGQEISKRSDLMATLVSLETGKPFGEAKAEVSLLEKKIQVTIEEALPLVQTKELRLESSFGSIVYRPKGVMVVLGPFNFPVHLSHGHIVPALLTGNVCILKPSEKCPLSAQIYIEAAEAAGFPAGVLQLVQGDAELGMRLVRHDKVDGVLATCSLDVGTKIRTALADQPRKILALEMGGKNAAIVWSDADIEKTAKDIVYSSFLTTGQRCTALSRIYVHKAVQGELESKVHEIAKELIIAQPFHENPEPFMGPLISATSKDKFLRYAGIAESEGAEPLMRPKLLEGVPRKLTKPLPTGHYVSPSIYKVNKHDPKSAYQSHEIFGPDMFFCPVDDLEAAVNYVNTSKYGLVSCVFGVTAEGFHQIADKIECGLVYHNRASVGASGRLPFGGWKGSGNHRPAGIFAIYASTQAQSRMY